LKNDVVWDRSRKRRKTKGNCRFELEGVRNGMVKYGRKRWSLMREGRGEGNSERFEVESGREGEGTREVSQSRSREFGYR